MGRVTSAFTSRRQRRHRLKGLRREWTEAGLLFAEDERVVRAHRITAANDGKMAAHRMPSPRHDHSSGARAVWAEATHRVSIGVERAARPRR